MKVTQIASIMNAVNPEIIGVNTDPNTGAITPIIATVAEDGSNMLDAGKQVADWLTSENVNTYMKSIMDKVGETIFISDEYDLGEEFDIRKTSLEAGSITEMIFFHDGEWTANTSWDEIISGTETAAPTFGEMFGYHPVTSSAVTIRMVIIPRVRLSVSVVWQGCISPSTSAQDLRAISRHLA